MWMIFAMVLCPVALGTGLWGWHVGDYGWSAINFALAAFWAMVFVRELVQGRGGCGDGSG